jgi:16S rRNA processing protein RimM
MAPETLASRGLIVFGRIAGVHGLRGALRVRPDNPESDVPAIERVFVDQLGTPVEYRVRSTSRAGHGSFKMELEGVDYIEQAQALRGAEVYLAVEDLPPVAQNQFYYFQVVGLRVETTDGRPLGTIAEVFFNGSNDVWVVKQGSGEVLVPVIDDVVRQIDLAGGRAVIEAIPGLLK